jgi:hypothetical protein
MHSYALMESEVTLRELATGPTLQQMGLVHAHSYTIF